MPPPHLHPDVWLLVGAIAGAYVYAVRRVGPRVVHPVERAVTRRQAACFGAALVLLWAVVDYPVHDIAEHYLYSVHMVQHMILSLVFPPLVLLGTPDWMMRWALGRAGIRAARVLTRPFVALVAFNGVVAAMHIPAAVTLASTNEAFHFAMHVVLVVAAFMMWSPVLTPLMELPKLTYPKRMVYLFLQSLLPTVPASFLTFGRTVVYHVYERAPVRLYGLSPLTDQLIAGLIMKLAGGLIIWSFIAAFFFKWMALEEREGVDVLEWSKLERGSTEGLVRR